jgi:putative PIN family toxin of toxin-antitoxin system
VAPPEIVIDTNVLVSALRSQEGASHRLVKLIGTGRFEINVSVPLVLEYEQAAKDLLGTIALTDKDIGDLLDYLCLEGKCRETFFLWRPFLRDPKDDMILELAVAAGCDWIVTHNLADFRGSEQFGIRMTTPHAFLRRIGELP